MKSVNPKKWLILGIFLLLCLPLISFSSSENKIYVDDDATGTQDGSKDHPYKTITRALKHADEDTEIKVKKGTYEENIVIPKGVEVIGDDKDDVIIKAKDDDLTTVKMKHKTKLMKVTVKGGKEGVKVKEGDKALIYKCVIKKSEGNGIYIEEGDKSKSEEVSIIETKIKDNDRTGIYSQGRKVVIEDNEIYDNGSDGIDLRSESKAWIKSNYIGHNSGSGIKVRLDDSKIYTKGNRISSNKREGIEINLRKESGLIVLKKDKIKNNGNYAVSRVQRSSLASNLWNGVSVESSVEFLGNKKGTVSHIFLNF